MSFSENRSDHVSITGITELCDIKVFTLSGALIRSEYASPTSTQLDTASLLPGMYLLRIGQRSKDPEYHRIVKN